MTQKVKVVGIIPARYGSTRLLAKALVDLCGKPMIQRVYERAQQAKLIDKVIVATDHIAIADTVRNFGGEVMMTPEGLRTGSDRVAYVAQLLNEGEIFVNVQGDEPLIPPPMIDEAIKLLLDDVSIDIGTLVRKIESDDEMQNPNIVKVVFDAKGFALYFSRAPIPFSRDSNQEKYSCYKHIGLYVFRRSVLSQFARWNESDLERVEKLEQLRFLEHGCKIKVAVTTYDSIPVDTPQDIERVEHLLRQSTSIARV